MITKIIFLFAMTVRALFFAPIILLDYQPIGQCSWVEHLSIGDTVGICIPYCNTKRLGEPKWAYEWCGNYITVRW